MSEEDWTHSIKLYHLKAAGYITQNMSRESFILDCGCGWGQVGKILEYCGYENFMGFDISRTKINTCCKLGLKAFEYSIETIPFPPKSVDCIICMQVFEHLEKEIYEKALNEIRRVVKEGGLIILSFPIGDAAKEQNHCVNFVEKKKVLNSMSGFHIVYEDEIFGRYESADKKSLFCALRKN